jgi:hypothetical protein
VGRRKRQEQTTHAQRASPSKPASTPLGHLLEGRVITHPVIAGALGILLASAIAGVGALLIHRVGHASHRPLTTSTRTNQPGTAYQGVGQIGGGEFMRVSRATGQPTWSTSLSAPVGSLIIVKARAHNGGPDAVTGVTAHATLGAVASKSMAVLLTFHISNPMSPSVSSVSDAVSVHTTGGRPFCPLYIEGSTKLDAYEGGTIRALPDGITKNGAALGRIEVGLDSTRLVQFEIRLVGTRGGEKC